MKVFWAFCLINEGFLRFRIKVICPLRNNPGSNVKEKRVLEMGLGSVKMERLA